MYNHGKNIFKPNVCIKIKLIKLEIKTTISNRTPIPIILLYLYYIVKMLF